GQQTAIGRSFAIPSTRPAPPRRRTGKGPATCPLPTAPNVHGKGGKSKCCGQRADDTTGLRFAGVQPSTRPDIQFSGHFAAALRRKLHLWKSITLAFRGATARRELRPSILHPPRSGAPARGDDEDRPATDSVSARDVRSGDLQPHAGACRRSGGGAARDA